MIMIIIIFITIIIIISSSFIVFIIISIISSSTNITIIKGPAGWLTGHVVVRQQELEGHQLRPAIIIRYMCTCVYIYIEIYIYIYTYIHTYIHKPP